MTARTRYKPVCRASAPVRLDKDKAKTVSWFGQSEQAAAKAAWREAPRPGRTAREAAKKRIQSKLPDGEANITVAGKVKLETNGFDGSPRWPFVVSVATSWRRAALTCPRLTSSRSIFWAP